MGKSATNFFGQDVHARVLPSDGETQKCGTSHVLSCVITVPAQRVTLPHHIFIAQFVKYARKGFIDMDAHNTPVTPVV